MSMKKPAVLLALVGACALAVTGPATLAAPPTPAQPDQGTSASSLPVGDLDSALTSKNGETATPDADVTVSGQDPARLVGIIVQLQDGADRASALASINEAVAGFFPNASVSVEREYANVLDGFALKAPAGALDAIRRANGVQAAFLEREGHVNDAAAVDAEGGTQAARTEGQDPANLSAQLMMRTDQVAQKGEGKVIAVIDESGLIAPKLESDEEIRFETTELPTEEARRELTEKFGVLWIGGDILENSNNVRLYANSSSSLALESNITGQIERILETEKLKAYNIENLSQILEQVETKVVMQTFRNDKSQEEDTQAQSSAVATGVGYVLGFILYMFLLIYGAMVMQSVIEEKNNRVLEVMVSSVRPFDLMMGKILGVASVAVVQVLIWGVLIVGVGALVMPHLMPEEVMAGAQAMQQGMPDAAAMTDMNPEMLQAVAAMTDLGYIIKIFVSLLLFVFGGYLLYSAMFAAVGSAVDNVQDASQLQMPITLPIILALLMMFVVIRDPNSQMAFWFSIIPFTSPIVMMARIPYDIPLWEIVLSLVLLYGSFVGMVWVASKIYRVGIFMYGKKPSLKELFKWIRYKY